MIFFSVILFSHIVRFENNVLCKKPKQYWVIGRSEKKPLVTLPELASLSGQRVPQPAAGTCTLPDVLKALATQTAISVFNESRSHCSETWHFPLSYLYITDVFTD